MNTPPKARAAASPEMRMIAGILGGFIAVCGGFLLVLESIKSGVGWLCLISGTAQIHSSVFYDAKGDVAYNVSLNELISILAGCTGVPLVLLLAFGHHTEWTRALVWLFFASSIPGPLLMLWRYKYTNAEERTAEGKRSTDS